MVSAKLLYSATIKQLCGSCVRNLIGIEPGTLDYAINNGFHSHCPNIESCAKGDTKYFIKASENKIQLAKMGTTGNVNTSR